MELDVIIYAMQLSVEADKRTSNYIKAILNSWSKSGIKTLLQAKSENKAFKSTKKTGKKESNFEEREYEDLSYLYANRSDEGDER